MKKIAIRFCIVIVFLLASFQLYSYAQVDRPALVNTEGRSFQLGTVTAIVKDNLQENGSRMGDQIVQVQVPSVDGKEEVAQANCPNGLLFGTVCEPGMRVVLISSKIGDLQLHTVYSMDRSMPIFSFIAVFLLLLCLVGGKKGCRSALALLFTFICFFYLFFPMLFHGVQPVAAAILTSFLVLTVTIYLINGATAKALSAGISSAGGIFAAGVAAVLFGKAAALSGYNVANIESLLFVSQNMPIDVGQILFAGILFSSLGAVMDIAMDVAAAVDELRRKNGEIEPWELFFSGLRVGRDVMGTMATTLILAFFGGSLGVWVLDYAYDLPYLQLINSNAVGLDIMQGLSGSIGVILTVPLTAVCSAWLPEYAKKGRFLKRDECPVRT